MYYMQSGVRLHEETKSSNVQILYSQLVEYSGAQLQPGLANPHQLLGHSCQAQDSRVEH